MDIFTIEEINLMCVFDTADKTELVSALQYSLPYVYEPELKELTETVIHKLKNMPETDFNPGELFVTGDYDEVYESGV